jgi:RNA polymerase sigma factor (sigma-70 family)
MMDVSRNDLELFEELFRRYYSLLTARAFELCGNWQMAEDAVQEFYADIWAKKSWQSIATHFAPYAVKAVQYKTISLIRKSVRQNTLNDPNEHLQEADERLEAEQQNDKLQRELKLIEALNALPAQRKEAFLLAHYHNRSYTEISEQMGISVNTVKTHLRLAMSQLRQILLLFFILFIFL